MSAEPVQDLSAEVESLLQSPPRTVDSARAESLAWALKQAVQAAWMVDPPRAEQAQASLHRLAQARATPVLTALAAFAKSYREAQGYLPMLMFLPMIPTLFLMISPVKTQLWMLAVPFLGQNQLILRILRKEAILPVEWAVCLGVGFLIAGIVWFVAARLYHREQLAISG